MAGHYIAVLVAASLGQFPNPFAGAFQGPPPAAPYQGPPPAAAYQGPGGGGGPGSSQYGPGATLAAPNSTQAFNTGDPFYPYDYEPNWTHGYYQEIPAYGGYHFFRPYNYKHVMPQSQVSAAWGNSPNMPYSHQYFDRVSGHQTVWNSAPRSNIARSPKEVNEKLAEVDGRVRRNKSRANQPQYAEQRQNQGVMPAGHRDN